IRPAAREGLHRFPTLALPRAGVDPARTGSRVPGIPPDHPAMVPALSPYGSPSGSALYVVM
ncbi:MAG TPA: hypothetical protein PLF11_15445, partial [Bacillota bacterium]|nr:hypothetical protein [Bacillota bacterium]